MQFYCVLELLFSVTIKLSSLFLEGEVTFLSVYILSEIFALFWGFSTGFWGCYYFFAVIVGSWGLFANVLLPLVREKYLVFLSYMYLNVKLNLAVNKILLLSFNPHCQIVLLPIFRSPNIGIIVINLTSE
jgi:hypothetical protein